MTTTVPTTERPSRREQLIRKLRRAADDLESGECTVEEARVFLRALAGDRP